MDGLKSSQRYLGIVSLAKALNELYAYKIDCNN